MKKMKRKNFGVGPDAVRKLRALSCKRENQLTVYNVIAAPKAANTSDVLSLSLEYRDLTESYTLFQGKFYRGLNYVTTKHINIENLIRLIGSNGKKYTAISASLTKLSFN